MNEAEAEKVARNLEHISPVGKKIYNLIKQSHLTKTDIRKRTSLPTKQVDDELSALAGYNLIKSIKSKDKKNVKTWILFHENEEEQQEIKKSQNQDLIALILKKNSTLSNIKKEAIKYAYSLDMFDEIIEMLRMKAQIFVNGDEVTIRQLKQLYVPCLTCQLNRLCSPGNTINPSNCPYLASW